MRLLRRTVDGHSISCREVVGLVTDYLDGALKRADARRFEAHLSECDGCAEHLRQIRATIALAGRLREEDIDPVARQELLEVYRRWKTVRDD